METEHRGRLERFVESYADTLGGLLERDAEGDLVLLEPATEKLRLLTFDPDGLTERAGSELVAPGSAILEELLERARRRGRVARATLELPRVPDRLVAGRVAQALVVAETEVRVDGLEWVEAELAIFLFRATFISDVREEELVEVVVDRSTGRLVRRWEEWHQAGWLRDGAPRARVLAGTSLAAAYEAARTEALRGLTSRINWRRGLLASVREREATRVARYHRELEEELLERAGKESDPTRRAALLARVDANRREKERSAGDLESKYALSVEMECVSLLGVGLPKAVATCALADPKRGWRARLDVLWNSAERVPEPADCPLCGRPGFEFALSRRGLACGRCSA